jgi:hypothetical protein
MSRQDGFSTISLSPEASAGDYVADSRIQLDACSQRTTLNNSCPSGDQKNAAVQCDFPAYVR